MTKLLPWDDGVDRDHERITFLETLNARAINGGLVVLRDSEHGRGWRLHETSSPAELLYGVTPKPTVREAIDDAMRRANEHGMNELKGDRQ